MNAIVLVFAAALAVAHGGVIAHTGLISQTVVAPAVKSTLIQGPSTSTHVVGPDGSQIIAHAPGASVRTSEHVGLASEVITPVVAAHAAPVIAAPLAYSAGVVATAPVVAAHAAPLVAHAAPVLAASPVLARTLVASPLTASGYPVLAAGSGIEGQYIHDLTEHFFDDGSYKGEIY